jgi:hypothetical protein
MFESGQMIDATLIPSGTVLTDKGDSTGVEITSAESRVFLLDLKITEAVEQEYIELWVLGSSDGNTWGSKPLAVLPQRFYAGGYPTLIDLTADPETKFVRLHWELSRWGRGELKPKFRCGVTFREIPQELLREVRAEADSRR